MLNILKIIFILKISVVTLAEQRYNASGNERSPSSDLKLGNHKTKEWCDPILKCLQITDEWYSINRLVNVLPDSRIKINTRFYLNTRENPNPNEDYLVSADDLSSLALSSFDILRPTKFIVHGFIDSGDTKWLREMVTLLLNYGDYNVIRVNWGSGSHHLYKQSTADTRVVGLEIGHFVNTLISTWGLDPAGVHCIGHSLGAHACGYGGEQIDKLGRITGLDPAGPYFTGTPHFVHLDPTDALFVDVIHTDADVILLMGYGTYEPMGNLDFYVNSGHDQPGCDSFSIAIDLFTNNIIDEGREILACSHLRSVEYFLESLSSPKCDWLAHECHDYKSFEEGQCFSCGDDDNSRCAYMGIRADEYVEKSRTYANFFINTDKKSPYCMHHYEVTILTAYPSEAESWVVGRLYMWLYGDRNEVIQKIKITDKHERIDHGQIKSTMFLSHQNVGQILRIELKWVYDDELINPGTYCMAPFCNRSLFVQTVQVSLMNVYPESKRLQYTVEACSSDGSFTKLNDGQKKSFLTSPDCVSI